MANRHVLRSFLHGILAFAAIGAMTLTLTACDESTPLSPESDDTQVQAPDGTVTAAASGCGRLLPGEALYPGESVYSCNGFYRLVFQTDRNLVLYASNTPVWATSTVGANPLVAVMQGDGNFVVYAAGWTPVWNSQTWGYNGAGLLLGDTGTLTINRNNTLLWKRGDDLSDPNGTLMGSITVYPLPGNCGAGAGGYPSSYLGQAGQPCELDSFVSAPILGNRCDQFGFGTFLGRIETHWVTCLAPPK